MFYITLIYFGIGAIILLSELGIITGEKAPPPHIRASVEEVRAMFSMRPDIMLPLWFLFTVIFWLPLLLYALLERAMGWDDGD